MARLIRDGEFVGPGERAAAAALESELPASWVVIANKIVVNPAGNTRELDFVVVGEHTLFVIDEKHYYGTIRGDEKGWVLSGGASHPSPISKIEMSTRQLRGLLEEAVPRLRTGLAGRPWAFGRVLLSRDDVACAISDPRVATQVLRLGSCSDELQLVDREQPEKASISAYRQGVLDYLVKLKDRPNTPKQIGTYEVVEVVRATPGDQLLRARHEDGSERLLALLERPSTVVPAKEAAGRTRQLREYDALKRIAALDRAPQVDPYQSWEEDRFWVVPIHLVNGRSLRTDSLVEHDPRSRLTMIADAFKGLGEVHAADVLHRNLSPDTVWVRDDGRIVFTELRRARVASLDTVAPLTEPAGDGDPFASPELRVDLAFASAASDVYSLSATVIGWVTGDQPSGDPAVPFGTATMETLRSALPDEAVEMLRRCLVEDERLRPAVADVCEWFELIVAGLPFEADASHAPVADEIAEVDVRIDTGTKSDDALEPHPKPAASNDDEAVVAPPGGRQLAADGREIIANRFLLLAESLVHGGIADVYRAIDLREPDRPVALKVIRQPAAHDWVVRLTFERESEALRALPAHENIVTLIDAGRDASSGEYYLALEWLPTTLPEYLNMNPGFRAWDRFGPDIAMPLARALAAAHEKRVLHRDVKPSNVLVTTIGRPKLADFGIAALKSRLPSGQETLATFMSRPFAPPDRESATEYDRDVFGFGVTVIACLSGADIADYPDIPGALDAINAPEGIFDLLRRCVSFDPTERPQNGPLLLAQLERLVVPRTEVGPRSAVHIAVTGAYLQGELANAGQQRGQSAQQYLVGQLTEAYGRRAPSREDQEPAIWLYGEGWRFSALVSKSPPRLAITTGRRIDPEELDRDRERSTPLPMDFTTGLVLDERAASAALNELLDRLTLAEEHRDEEEHARDERRLFLQWSNQLRAEEAFEAGRDDPLPYRDPVVEGSRLYVTLDREPQDELVGQQRVIKVGDRYQGRFRGTVAGLRGRTLELALETEPAVQPPRTGSLVINTGPSSVALRRQREALYAVRYETPDLQAPNLPALVLHPDSATEPVGIAPPRWIQPSLDEDKQSAVQKALGAPDFFLVHGPPGTGKTTFIAELIAQHIAREPNARVLLTSQGHVALDNALEALRRVMPPGLRMTRLAPIDDPRVADDVADLLLERQLPAWRRDIRRRSEQHLETWAEHNGLDIERVRLAVSLGELVAMRRALDDLDEVSASLGGTDEDGQTSDAETTEAEAEADERDRERSDLERDRRRLIAAVAPLAKLPRSRLEAMDAGELEARAAAAVDARTPQAAKLSELIRLQAEWFERAARGPEFDAAFLKVSHVVAATCVGLAGFRSAQDLTFDLCVLDEASKAKPAEALVPFIRAKRWVLVGDQYQLPPFQEHAMRDVEMRTRFDLDEAELGKSLFDHMAADLPPGNKALLSRQYRMVPAIGDLISTVFYSGQLVSERRDEGPDLGLALDQPVTWLDTGRVPGHQERRAGEGWTSFNNPVEADALADLLMKIAFVQRGRKGNNPISILMLSGYRPQVSLMQAAVDSRRDRLTGLDVEVNSIDAAQGRESDVLLYSVTRSSPTGTTGFLADRRRINVALSRGKFGLVVCGDLGFCEQQDGPLREVIAYVREHPATCEIVNLGDA